MTIFNKNKDHAMLGIEYSDGIIETIYIHENVNPKNIHTFLEKKDFEQMLSIIRGGDIREIANSYVYKFIDDPQELPEDCESVKFIDEKETLKFFKSSVCRYFYLMKWKNEEWFFIDKNQKMEWKKL